MTEHAALAEPRIEEPHVAEPDGPDIDRVSALKIAAFWLGCLSVVASVALVTSPMMGAMAAIVSVVAMGYAVIGSPTWELRRMWPHAVAAVLAAMSIFGLCATKCGTYAAYEAFLGIPTGAVAVLLHGTIALALVIQTRKYPGQELIGDLLIAIGIGGSVFYAAVLAISGTWCGACFAIHALMAVQLVELIINRGGLERYASAATVLVAAGAANAAYHHRPLPEVRNDATELLTYMRSLWTEEQPPQRVTAVSEEVGAATRNAPEVIRILSTPASPARVAEAPPRESATPPARPATLPANASPVHQESVSMRAISDANRWGRRDAPTALALGIDMGCPVCAQQFAQVLELKDLVDAGKLQVRFLLSYKNDASQAMTSIAYAAGLVNERALVETIGSFYVHQKDILTAADAIQFLPEVFPRKHAIDTVRAHKDDITKLMTDAAALKETMGSTGDPSLWFFVAGGTSPVREFKGLTLSSILRISANSLGTTP